MQPTYAVKVVLKADHDLSTKGVEKPQDKAQR